MMTQQMFVEKAKSRLPSGVKDGESNESLATRLLAEGFTSIVADAIASGLVTGVTVPTTTPAPSHDAIAKRAYAISQKPGAGTAAQNWAKAEAEIKAGK